MDEYDRIVSMPVGAPELRRVGLDALFAEGKLVRRFPKSSVNPTPCRKWRKTKSALGLSTWCPVAEDMGGEGTALAGPAQPAALGDGVAEGLHAEMRVAGMSIRSYQRSRHMYARDDPFHFLGREDDEPAGHRLDPGALLSAGCSEASDDTDEILSSSDSEGSFCSAASVGPPACRDEAETDESEWVDVDEEGEEEEREGESDEEQEVADVEVDEDLCSVIETSAKDSPGARRAEGGGRVPIAVSDDDGDSPVVPAKRCRAAGGESPPRGLAAHRLAMSPEAVRDSPAELRRLAKAGDTSIHVVASPEHSD